MSNSAKSRRFDTHLNIKPELASRLPKLSRDVVDFLGEHGELAEEIAQLPTVVAPEFDDSLPLTNYFVSTSHNTYLLGKQLWGKASPSSYTHVISNGAHCVEIDVWPGHSKESGPIVTHGWTLAQHIHFRDVCDAINEAGEAKQDDWPIFVSLECHVDVDGQQELVDIMETAWGDKLVRSPVGGVDSLEIAPKDLKRKIVMMIEYYPIVVPKAHRDSSEPPSSSSSSSSETSDDEHPKPEKPKISDALFQLGIYAHSMKPKKGWLRTEITQPPHVLINISESAMNALLPRSTQDLVANGQAYLRRVYPRGTRIASGNLDPLKFWRAGSHFAALNWQEFDSGMQLNEAMFAGTSGWVLKPSALLGGQKSHKRVKLSLHIVGLSSLPRPEDDDFSLRVRVHLLHSSKDQTWKSKSNSFKDHKDPEVDVMFNEHCEWRVDDDPLTFLRIIVVQDERLERDSHLAIFCARVQYMQQGFRFLRLLDTKGKDTHATLLVNTHLVNT